MEVEECSSTEQITENFSYQQQSPPLLQATVSSDPWSKQEIYSTIILSEIMAQPSYGDLRDNQMSYSDP